MKKRIGEIGPDVKRLYIWQSTVPTANSAERLPKRNYPSIMLASNSSGRHIMAAALGSVRFSTLRDVSSFKDKIKGLVDKKDYDAYLKGGNSQLAALLRNDKLAAFAGYEKGRDVLRVRYFKQIGKDDTDFPKLLEQIKRVAESKAVKAIIVSADETNPGRAFLAKNGFTPVGSSRMELALQPSAPPKQQDFMHPSRKRARDEEPDKAEPKQPERSDKRSRGDVAVRSRGNGEVKTHVFPMKGTIFMEKIMLGDKTHEGRINGPGCQRMQIGDHLKLFDRRAGWGIVCEIVSKDVYWSFEDMLKAKGVLKMLPQLAGKAQYLTPENLLEEGVRIYRGFPGSQRIQQQGCVAIGVKFLERVDS